MTRQRWAKGAILAVPLSCGEVIEAQMLDRPEFAFFSPDDRAKLLFRLWVHKSAYTSGRWLKIGMGDVPPELDKPVDRFKEDPISGKLSIYGHDGDTPAKLEECLSLERAAVWDPEHVESRLEDYLAGRPNKWAQNLKPAQDK